MGPDTKKNLKEIGLLLEQNRYEDICFFRSGIVRPCVKDTDSLTLTKESDYERQGTSKPSAQQGPSGPPTDPRSRTSGKQRQAGRSGSSLQASQVVSAEPEIDFDKELEAVHDAFPNTQVLMRTGGLWLVTESLLLPGLWKKAKFFTWAPHLRTSPVRGWGFWDGKLLNRPIWIGPRHTNYDGSICAFEPKDETWVPGEAIVVLLRYYTLWAVRHLHLQVFGKWPGYQVAHSPWERLLEVRRDEYCGCERFDKHYSECCYDQDLKTMKNNNELVKALVRGELRKPLIEIENFMNGNLPDSLGLAQLSFEKYVKIDQVTNRIVRTL